jgi:hypothetical protein
MKKWRFIAIFAVAALVVPGSAAAKGPSKAIITGPGLDRALAVDGYGEGDTSTPLGLLVSDGGFFPEVFGQSPNPLLRRTPAGLGSKYEVTYTVPGGSSTNDTLRQDLYPYAVGGPVTHMAPNQSFWGDQKTLGGWYRGTSALKAQLISAGLPKTDLSRRATSDSRRVGVAVGAGILLAGGALLLLRRRR